tara:strand:+ start:649 stop:1248 length:600 start_codon:yes stop_codon:yes gene_type:complete
MASTLKVNTIAHTGGTTGINIDDGGYVTKPTHPAFVVYHDGQGSVISEGGNVDGRFSFKRTELNIGGNPSGLNGIQNHFKAPVAGTYHFHFCGFACGPSNGGDCPDAQNNHFLIVRASTASGIKAPASTGTTSTIVAQSFSEVKNNTGNTTTYPNMAMSGTCFLAKDDCVGMVIKEGYMYAPANTLTSKHPKFGGFLIG